VEEEEKRK